MVFMCAIHCSQFVDVVHVSGISEGRKNRIWIQRIILVCDKEMAKSSGWINRSICR